MTSPKSFRVGTRTRGVTVSPWHNPAGALYWRFKSPLTGKDVRRRLKSHARQEAKDQLDAIANHSHRFHHLTASEKSTLLQILDAIQSPHDLPSILDFLKERTLFQIRPKLSDSVRAYIDHKTQERGHKTQHLRSVEIDLTHLADFHPRETTLQSLTLPQLRTWHHARVGNAGWKRRNDCRTNLLSLYNHAHRMGEIDDATKAICARLPLAARERTESIRYASHSEALFLLHHVRPEFRLWLILGLFAGLRPEEIIPEKNRRRRGITRQEIDIETETIYIPREVAGKIGKARRVPFAANLVPWLLWANWHPDQVGPIHNQTPARARETARLGSLMDDQFKRAEGWPKDFLRHTYASHRNAVIQNLSQLAIELGNSIAIIQEHYNQPLPKAQGETFFKLHPDHLKEETIHHHKFKA